MLNKMGDMVGCECQVGSVCVCVGDKEREGCSQWEYVSYSTKQQETVNINGHKKGFLGVDKKENKKGKSFFTIFVEFIFSTTF